MKTKTVGINTLTPHPRNYRHHPADQLDHLTQSITENGIYRNIIVADDFTILAGHGVWEAAKALGIEEVPVVILPLKPDDPRALKVLTGDNEIGRLAEIDDRALSEILKQISQEDETGLIGSGFDEMMLANLVFVTRPASEIKTNDAAAEWVGLPSFSTGLPDESKIVVSFDNDTDRAAFFTLLGIEKGREPGKAMRFPIRQRENLAHYRWEAGGDGENE